MIYLGSGIYSNSGPSMSHDGGYTWSKHKYIRKEGNRYIYPEDLQSPRGGDARRAYEAQHRYDKKSNYKNAENLFNHMRMKYDFNGDIQNPKARKTVGDQVRMMNKRDKDHYLDMVKRVGSLDDLNKQLIADSKVRASRESGEKAVQRAKAAREKNAAKKANSQRQFETEKYLAGQRARQSKVSGEKAVENAKKAREKNAIKADKQQYKKANESYLSNMARQNGYGGYSIPLRSDEDPTLGRRRNRDNNASLASKQALNDKLGKAQAKISATRAYQAASEARAKNRNKDAISGVTSKRSGERAVESAKSARARNASKAKMKEMEDKALRNWTNNFLTNVTRINEQKKYRTGQKNRVYSEKEISRMAADNRATNKRNKEIADYMNSNPGKAQGIDDIKVRRKKQKKNYSST